MTRGPFGILRHAAQMVGRNLRTYRRLSVTIVLSFAVLFGYLGLMDSRHYNSYKEIFALDRGIVHLNERMNPLVADQLVEKAGQIGSTRVQRMSCLSYGVTLFFPGCTLAESGEAVYDFPTPEVWSLPARAWGIYSGLAPMEITWFDGAEHPEIVLHPGEILLDEQFCSAFGLQGGGSLSLTLLNAFSDEGDVGKSLRGTFTVVGTVPSELPIELERDEQTGEVRFGGDYHPILVFSGENFGQANRPDLPWQTVLTFYTDQPEEITQLVNSFFSYNPAESVCRAQETALQTIRTEKRTKAFLCCALLLLLGINLYSSFSNALQSRKFEIGVKRALGASAFSVVRQFLYESLLVLLADIALAVVLVMDAFLVYKVIYEARPDRFGEYHQWVIYISPYSLAMFAVCSAVLTLVFSLIFAFQSTQVEVIEYLKAE